MIALVIGGILSIAGLLVAADLVLGSEYRLLGLQLTVFGLITIMAVILGTFGGLFTGWRGWYSQMIERRSTRDEPKEYPTTQTKNKTINPNASSELTSAKPRKVLLRVRSRLPKMNGPVAQHGQSTRLIIVGSSNGPSDRSIEFKSLRAHHTIPIIIQLM